MNPEEQARYCLLHMRNVLIENPLFDLKFIVDWLNNNRGVRKLEGVTPWDFSLRHEFLEELYYDCQRRMEGYTGFLFYLAFDEESALAETLQLWSLVTKNYLIAGPFNPIIDTTIPEEVEEIAAQLARRHRTGK